ncbi:MAG TPA: Glu/Leu/Phe/Val dehydrogenase, partial [Holophagaceae bacterium]
LGGALDRAAAERLQASLVVEGAHLPTTLDGDRRLRERGILVIPDLLACAGGVTLAYFEWVQNLQQLFWDEADVLGKVERVILQAFTEVRDQVAQRDCSWRHGALALALSRVRAATELRGW